MIFWIIPEHTETVEDVWLRPTTLPYIAAAVVVFTSIIHLIFPRGKAELDISLALRAALFFIIALIGLWLMHVAGFLIAAPLLIAVVMFMIGERRPLWLIAGIVMIPLAMWSSIVLLLNRPLP